MSVLNKKVLISLTIMLMSLFLLSSCADLGEVDDLGEYYDIFTEVLAITASDEDSYDMENFYSASSVNDYFCVLDYDNYQYLSVKVDRDITISDIALYVNSENSTSLYVDFYTASSKPEGQESSNEPIYDTFVYKDGNVEKSFQFKKDSEDKDKVSCYSNGAEVTVSFTKTMSGFGATFAVAESGKSYEYECVVTALGLVVTNKTTNVKLIYKSASSSVLAQTSLSLSPGEWDSIRFSKYNINGTESSKINISSGNWLVFKFLNNCPEGTAYGYNPIKIKETNIMIRIE